MSKRSSILLLLLTLSLSLPLSLLRADDFFAIKDKVISDSVFKIGFFYFTPLLLLDNVGFTSNIYTYDDRDKPDWTGDLGLGLSASAILANRLILQAEELPHYSYYLENKNLRAWSNRFSTSAYSYFGPFNLKVRFMQNNLNQRPRLEFSRPFRYTENEWSGETDIGRKSKLFLTTYFALKNLAYEEVLYLENYNLSQRLNHRQNTFGLRLNRRIFTGTIIYLNFELSDYIFAASSERDTRAQTLMLGIKFPSIGGLQGSFQIGLNLVDPKNPMFKQSQSISGSGNVHATLFERLRLNLFYALGTNFSYSANELFYHNQSLGGGAELYLTRFLKGGATYEYGRLKYQSFLDLAILRNDRIYLQRYYLALPFLGNSSLGFAYNVYHLTSDTLNLNYKRSFWGGFISYEF